MLKIRLQRVGKKHEPVFRFVLTDSKNGPKSGKFLEILGHFDARHSEKAEFKTERIKYWLSQGTKVSDTVHNILVDRKVIDGKKINKLPKKTAIVAEKTEKTAGSAKSSVEPKEEPKTETESEVAPEVKPEEEVAVDEVKNEEPEEVVA